MSAVLVTESDANPSCAKYSTNCASSCSAHPTPLCLQDTSVKLSAQGASLGSERGSGPQRAAASSSSSNGQTGGSSNGIGFKCQSTLQPGQLQIVELAGGAGPALREGLR